jgi:hypothetical protein
MKLQTTRHILTFIIVLIFLGTTTSVKAQKICTGKHPCPKGYTCVNGVCLVTPMTYFCQCNIRGYGCNGDSKCYSFCLAFCPSFTPFLAEVNDNSGKANFQNSYDPHTRSGTSSFSLPQTSKVELTVFSSAGAFVKKLSEDVFEKGEHSIEWNAGELAEGVYFLQMQSSEFYQIEKLTITK